MYILYIKLDVFSESQVFKQWFLLFMELIAALFRPESFLNPLRT